MHTALVNCMLFTFYLLSTYQLATSNTQSRSQLSSDIQPAFRFEISTYGCFSSRSLNFKYGDGICPVFRTVCVLLPPLGRAIPFH